MFVGSFNPTIFHPSWFAQHEIVPDLYDNISYDQYVSTPDLCQFKLQDEIAVRVFRNKFIAETSLESATDTLIDIVSATFKQLHHTPIDRMGINLERNYEGIPRDDWKNIGDVIAPKEIWTEIYTYIASLETSKKEELGLWTQTMKIPRNDELSGAIFHKTSVLDIVNRALQVSVNNDILTSNSEKDSRKALSILEEKSREILDETRSLVDNYMNRVGKQE